MHTTLHIYISVTMTAND